MLSSSQISVVLQGSLRLDQPGVAERAVASIRKVLPGAEVVISVPENESEHPIDCDVKCFYQDPGPDVINQIYAKPIEVNLTRQVLSTQLGLTRVTREYCLKFRPEFWLKSASFVAPIFDKIRVLNVYTPNPARDLRLFHVSDLIQFSKTTLLKDYWSEPGIVSVIKVPITRANHYPLKAIGQPYNFLLSPEQALTLDLARRKGLSPKTENGRLLLTFENWVMSQQLTENYFEVVTMANSGVEGPSRFEQASTKIKYSVDRVNLLNLSRIDFLKAISRHMVLSDGMIALGGSVAKWISPGAYENLSRAFSKARFAFGKLLSHLYQGVRRKSES